MQSKDKIDISRKRKRLLLSKGENLLMVKTETKNKKQRVD